MKWQVAEDPVPILAAWQTATPVQLSKKEMQVLYYASHAYSNKQIAASMGITVKTVKFHLTNIYKKTGTVTNTELMLWAFNNLILE